MRSECVENGGCPAKVPPGVADPKLTKQEIIDRCEQVLQMDDKANRVDGFGPRLRRWRINKNITADSLAWHIGVVVDTIRAYEAKRREPPISAVIKLALALDLTVEELLKADPPPSERQRAPRTTRLAAVPPPDVEAQPSQAADTVVEYDAGKVPKGKKRPPRQDG